MFLSRPRKPAQLKKVVYVLAWMVLGFLLSFLLHAYVEVNYINWLLSHGKEAKFLCGCALPPIIQVIIWLLGAVGGFFLGRFFWRKVYVERNYFNKKF